MRQKDRERCLKDLAMSLRKTGRSRRSRRGRGDIKKEQYERQVGRGQAEKQEGGGWVSGWGRGERRVGGWVKIRGVNKKWDQRRAID